MTRSLAAAVSRIAYCRDALAKRIPRDETHAAVLDALIEHDRDLFLLLAGVDTLGTIEDFHAAIEVALQENPK